MLLRPSSAWGQYTYMSDVQLPSSIALGRVIWAISSMASYAFNDANRVPIALRMPYPKLPIGARFWLFNTHTKHALIDGLYATRHDECMAAAEALGVRSLRVASIELVNAAEKSLPGPLARRARHVVEEIARVRETVAVLHRDDLPAVGKLLTASHRSSQTLFENSTAELDFLVDSLIARPGVYGARLTGGGFGGAVMAMTSDAFTWADTEDIVSAYQQKFGAKPAVLPTSTGDGAQLVSG